jgi:leucyl aminopeptidase
MQSRRSEGFPHDHHHKEVGVKLKLAAESGYRGSIRFMLQAASARQGKTGAPAVPDEVGQCVTTARDGKGRTQVVVSLGKAKNMKPDTLRCAGGAIARWLRAHRETRAGVDLPPVVAGVAADDVLVAVAEGILLADYAFDRHKTQPAARPHLAVDLLVKKPAPAQSALLRRTEHICAGVRTARDFAHEPPNVINPVTLARQVKTLATRSGLKCTILDQKKLAEMKAGGILGVGQGSVTPPRLIVLEYQPKAGARAKTANAKSTKAKSAKAKPVVLVGKAITFDTGGYSIKSKDGMLGMKYDKCGGTAVIGAMLAVAAVKPRVPVVGVIAAAENMIDGAAYRPDDIITTLSGKTVQIVSADAEGRMVLCDAMTYAQRKYQPRAMIDLATLTGGVVVALGTVAAGVFSNDEKLQQALIDAGTQTHERLWPLPVWDEYLELLAGDDSDIKNSGSREAHGIQGGVFLKQFVEPGTSLGPPGHRRRCGYSQGRPVLPQGRDRIRRAFAAGIHRPIALDPTEPRL